MTRVEAVYSEPVAGMGGLSVEAVYMTPTGRCCTWVPPRNLHRNRHAWAEFEYTGAAGLRQEGFVLSPGNCHVLRRVA